MAKLVLSFRCFQERRKVMVIVMMSNFIVPMTVGSKGVLLFLAHCYNSLAGTGR